VNPKSFTFIKNELDVAVAVGGTVVEVEATGVEVGAILELIARVGEVFVQDVNNESTTDAVINKPRN
jgi:hypothetical protein